MLHRGKTRCSCHLLVTWAGQGHTYLSTQALTYPTGSSLGWVVSFQLQKQWHQGTSIGNHGATDTTAGVSLVHPQGTSEHLLSARHCAKADLSDPLQGPC